MQRLGGDQRDRAVRLLRREFGKVHVNFGTPLALEDILYAQHASWRDEPYAELGEFDAAVFERSRLTEDVA